MARCQFGASSADFVQDERGNRFGGREGTVWRSQTGDTGQVTDLLNAADDPVEVVTSSYSPKGLIQFQGPDDGTSVLWLDFGGAGRIKVTADPVSSSALVVDAVSGTYPARPADALCVIWRGTTTPTAAVDGDLFIDLGA